MRGRAFTALLLAGSFCGTGSGRCWAANTNPTVNFQTNTTNATNPIGRNFYLQLYSLSGFTNIRTTDTNTTGITNTIFQSNNLVVFAANFTNPSTNTNLVAPTGFNGLRFDPGNGVLYGIPTNNFILTISNNGLQVVSTNLIWTNQTIFTNGVVISNTTNSASNATATSFTNTLTTNPAYRFVFQAKPVLSFTNTNMTAGTTNSLPATNSNGLTFAYDVTNGPGYVTNSTDLVATNAGLISLQVVLNPTNSANVLWSSVTNSFPVTATNPNATGFGFITNTNAEPYTRTNLVFRQATPLALSNPGTSTFSWDPSNAAEKFESNGATWLRALSGSGSLVVTASRAATPTSSVTTASLTLTLSRAPNPITMAGFFSNYPATNSITNTNTTSLTLLATASNGTVNFATTNANVQITNGTTLRLLANGTSTVVASVTNANTNNYLPTDPITNTLIVNWPSPGAPVFTSTNRQNGTVGSAFTYTLSAAASNTNAFPVTYAATNLPEGLTFTPANQISGIPTQAGFYRIQLTASNAGGATTNLLTASIAPSPTFSVANRWTNFISLGSGTNSGGTYIFPGGVPVGLGTNTNLPSGFTQPVLLLFNTNTNPASPNWFAGVTNLSLVFSNSQTNLTSSIPLNVQPVAPGLSLASSVVGTPGVLLSVTNTINPAALTNIPGYPLSFRATNLPDGMFFNSTSGVIAGKPVFAGQRTALVWASNAIGSSPNGQVTFDIQALAGAPMQMSLAFTSAVGTYSVLNLPPGLILSPASGLVTGNPQAVGTFDLTVNFVRSGTAITNSTNRILSIRPPAPIPRVSSNLVTARTGRPFHFQPWVTGPGWGWAGADPLTATNFSTNWTNQILIGTSSVVLSSNSNGGIRPTTNGLTFTNRTNANELYLLWRSNLPSSWPWQALLRLRIPGNLTNSNAYAYPVLGVIRARLPSFPTNFPGDDYADGGLYADTNGVFPTATFYSPSTNAIDFLDSLGTNEMAVRFRFDTNNQTLVIAANTNLATNVFVGLITNTNLAVDWSLTNAAAAFQLALGSSFSNQAVSSNQILLRSFAVLPRGVGFYASNLPSGLNCDPETGTIYGTPTNTFSGLIYLYATNSQGTNFTGFRLQVIP